ncbi:glycine oxidase ThiO [Paenibacillus montaniterrae]|uniref:glycine oxidase n=1 Tax=Paenibacillus montaniterrae TaxID=429341 RepID=A0A919YRJ6_9BACL|nr:glycine oxidase ThiO [Paenibacillus montaniterrae]GIP19382.1 glycine oxidase ThiO [Paenibacillus montaniterrae]
MRKQYDVIVVGGGVIGAAIAYYLTRRQKRVLLLEQGRCGSGSSQAAAGMLGAQSEMNDIGPLFKLALQSRAMFPHLAEELKQLSGIDIELMMQGKLKVAVSAEQAQQYLATVDQQRQAGEAAEWLTTAEARYIEPLLGERIYGAMHLPGEGQVQAPGLNQAFIQAAIKLGAEISEYAAVHSLLFQQGRAIGAATANGAVYADQVVLAAGVWSKVLLEKAGVRLDLHPVKGECFSVASDAVKLGITIFSEGCYLVPKSGGRIVVGATMREREYDQAVTAAGVHELLGKALQLVPSLAHMRFEKVWAGLRPQTPDGLPVMGAVPGYAGLYVAAGHYRNGILLSPITGEAMAELLDKENAGSTSRLAPSGVDLQPFTLERFQLEVR